MDAKELDRKIGEHMAKREQLQIRLKEIEQAIEWQSRRIRELSLQHSISLNLSLPLDEQHD